MPIIMSIRNMLIRANRFRNNHHHQYHQRNDDNHRVTSISNNDDTKDHDAKDDHDGTDDDDGDCKAHRRTMMMTVRRCFSYPPPFI